MSSNDPLSSRVRAGLTWPAYDDWADHRPANVKVSERPPSTPAAAEQVASRRALARTVADRGPWLKLFDDAEATGGPLSGMTFAIKALMAVQGRRTTAASPVRAEAPVETATAPFIDLLRDRGACALGTVTMHEFAFGVTGINDHVGTAPNPAAPGRVPGGSSSGSASAVADGSATFAIGTDTGGSVRIPSAFCGIAGFKPAHGTYPAAGAFPLSATLDHVGLHATTVNEIATIHTALGHAVDAPRLPTRVGVARPDLEVADDTVRHAIETAIDRLSGEGCDIVEIAWPDPEMSFLASTGIMFSEAAAIHAPMLETHPDLYGADIKARLALGAALTGAEVAAAHRLRSDLIGAVATILSQVDVVLGPTVPIVAPRIADAADPELAPKIVANTRLGNVVGLPAVTLPAPGVGLPVGVQLLGAHNATVLGVGIAVEELLSGS